tara:strand:+ start:205 stop:723 length:519 start_codon:yes stop_codon:yes gene_type:complete
MSANFFRSDTPAEATSIKVNDIKCRGHGTVAEYLNVTGALSTASTFSVGTSITHDNIPSANIVQLTSISTQIDATAVANPYNFNVSTFATTLSAGSHTTFFLAMPPSFLNSLGFASVSPYYYSGVVGTAGIPVLTIITQENDKVLFMLKNEHPSNALNGNIHFRFKYELGST